MATAHPLATEAALRVLAGGGNAVDAAVVAQAVLCVTSPHACGVGGDVMALVAEPTGPVTAVNGTGLSARLHDGGHHADGGASVTVPGIVDGWYRLHERWGRLPWPALFEPAIELADHGIRVDPDLVVATTRQRDRLVRGGAQDWTLLQAPRHWYQPELAGLLRRVSADGPAAFYSGDVADAIAAAVAADGGVLGADDLEAHGTEVLEPVQVDTGLGRLDVQPPSSQGVLLALAVRTFDRLQTADLDPAEREQLMITIIDAVFDHRDDCADAEAVLAAELDLDASRVDRRGPRAYLHTAGVATADATGLMVSSLVSVFDDFGSGTFVRPYGFTLNNRGAGFTAGANAPRAAARPVHTLAPALLSTANGRLALSTPGADGQVQTLLQVLDRLVYRGEDLVGAVTAPRWRSEDGALLLEAGHPATDDLRARGHDVREIPAGDDRFGAVVAVRTGAGEPYAVADWRRRTTVGAV